MYIRAKSYENKENRWGIPAAIRKAANPPKVCRHAMEQYQNPDKVQVDQVQRTVKQEVVTTSTAR